MPFECNLFFFVCFSLFISDKHIFTEQLTIFEVWLDHGPVDKKPRERMPIVLQVRICAASVTLS